MFTSNRMGVKISSQNVISVILLVLRISETAVILRCSSTTVSGDHTNFVGEREKKFSLQQFWRQKCSGDDRGQKRIARLIRADWNYGN